MFAFNRRSFFAAGGAALSASSAQTAAQDVKSPPKRRLLESRLTAAQVAKLLVPRESWKPYPVYSDRARWQALPSALLQEMVAKGDQALKNPWTVLPATVFLEYVRTGNRSNYERILRARRNKLEALLWAECAEAKGRFLDEIGNGVWLQCEETFWGYPAHLSLQKGGSGLPNVAEPVIDLFAAEGGALLAWLDYLVGPQLDKVHKRIRERLHLEIDRRILTPYEKRTDFWWMGLEADRAMNNWNPWINSNCLACALLVESDPARRAAIAHKIVRSVDRFLDSYYDDGGCDEGPGYWGHAGGSLFDNLELLYSASDGKIDFYKVPLVGEIGRYIYRVHIAGDWFVNFADASARVGIDGDLVYRYGKRIGDANLQQLGALRARDSSPGGSALRFLPALFNYAEMQKAPARAPLVRDAWFAGMQVMTARTKEGTADGLFLAAQGGHNAESHNHNDVGNFIVYANGKPAIVDIGVETYTAKTFSSHRYDIWTMQSAYHNLPTVNGVMQGAGRGYAARNVSHKAGADAAEFELDIAGAYPPQAGIVAWRRTLRLDRGRNQVSIRDAFALQKDGGRVELTLMTPCKVTVGKGEIVLAGAVKVRFQPDLFDVAVEEVRTEDARLQAVWGESVRRILLKKTNLPARGEFSLLIVQA